MKWAVAFHDEFEPEFDELPREVQDELYAEAQFVELAGPETGWPHVDKLHGSSYANMKELRFEAIMTSGAWRSHLIRSVSPSYWLLAVRPVSAKSGFTRR